MVLVLLPVVASFADSHILLDVFLKYRTRSGFLQNQVFPTNTDIYMYKGEFSLNHTLSGSDNVI